MATPDPGWYPDPQERTIARWWDGTQWTAGTRQLAKPRREVGENFQRLALVVQLLLVVTAVVDVAIIYGDRFLLGVADQFTRREPDLEDAATVVS